MNKMDPMKNKDFLNWLGNRRRKKKLEKRQQGNQDKEEIYRYKKIAFDKIKQNRIWGIIKKRFNVQTGNPPPYPIKDWFFNKDERG